MSQIALSTAMAVIMQRTAGRNLWLRGGPNRHNRYRLITRVVHRKGMDEMRVATLNPAKYGRLCADALPKVIESDEEFDRLVAKMEELDFKRNPTPELFPPYSAA